MKSNQSTIQLRIDTKTKEIAKETLDEIGLDFSTAIKLFLKQVINRKSIPFEIRTENGFTSKYEKELLIEEKEILKNSKGYSSAEELHKDILI